MEVKQVSENVYEIVCGTVHYRELNTKIKDLVKAGAEKIILKEVYGQRYIGT